jgi:hypothetical protein
MKTIAKYLAASFVAVLFLSAALPAQAAAPSVSAFREGSGDNYRITVRGDAYGYIGKLAYRTQGSSLWTEITNLGTLDQSGYFTTILSFGNYGSVDLYATVNGQQSQTIAVSGNSNCVNNNCQSPMLTVIQSNVSLQIGQTATVSVYSYNNNYPYVSNNSNNSVASASANGNTVTLQGLSNGSSTVTVCAGNSSNCVNIYVTVAGPQNVNFWLNQTSVTVNQGQAVSIPTYTSSSVSGSVYVSSVSNSGIASVSVSGSAVQVYGNSTGSATAVICHNGANRCENLSITVTGGTSGSLNLINTGMPTAYVNQYYSYQLQAYGGTTPYYYSVQSGTLPPGLSLSSSGLIYGTPQNTGASYFTVRVSDNYSRSATQPFNLAPVCQYGNCVLGTSTYKNGTLISEGGTVYIVYKNTKTAFGNRAAFEGLGYSFTQVTNVGYANLSNTGYIITTANAAHPWGSWIKAGQTVYFVHESGLIPVGNYSTFLNNGGEDRFVVSANIYDFQRPMLSVMTDNDSRLR